MRYLQFGMLALFSSFSFQVQAVDISSDCLQSYSVIDKGFSYESQTYSCVLLEQNRASLYSQIINVTAPSTSINKLKLEVNALENQVSEAINAQNWSYFDNVVTVISSIASKVALTSCKQANSKIEIAKCVLTIVNVISENVDVIRNAADLSKKNAAAIEIKQQLVIARAELNGQVKLQVVKDNMVTSFNNYCQLIKTNCL